MHFRTWWFGTACVIEYQLERWNSQGSINMSANHGSSVPGNRNVLDFAEKASYLVLRLRWNVGRCEMIQQSLRNVGWASLGDSRISQPTANIAWSMTYSMEWQEVSRSVQILTRVGSLLHLLLGRLCHFAFDAHGLQLSSDSLLYTSSSSNIRCCSNLSHSWGLGFPRSIFPPQASTSEYE